MKLLSVVLTTLFVAVALAQGPGNGAASDERAGKSTPSPTPPLTSTEKPTSTVAPTTTPAPTTTAAPTTTVAPTTHAPTTTPRPKPQEATLANYTLRNGEEVCALVVMKVVVTQNTTSYPFVNGTLSEGNSKCDDTQVTLWIESVDGYQLQMKIEHDTTNFYIGELSVKASDINADRDNLTQFSTPMKQFYKCSSASQVSLGEEDVKIVFSEMKYQAFQKAKSADFVGSQLECVSDYHSDVVIIAIGCALALLVVVILVAYLIARRRNRQRGYQSV